MNGLEPYASWSLLMLAFPSLYCLTQSLGLVAVFLASYMVLIPFASLTFLHGANVPKIMGLSKKRLTLLALLLSMCLTVTYLTQHAQFINSVIVVAVMPLSEEIFFRGYMFGAFANAYSGEGSKGKMSMIFVSSIFFSIGHLVEPCLFLGQQPTFSLITDLGVRFLLGILLCLLFDGNKSVFHPTVAHALMNLRYVILPQIGP